MRFEDIKLGMKVVPHDKTAYRGDSLSYSGIWKECKKANQPYMYVTRTIDSVVVCSDKLGHGGDFFLASDLTPYEGQYICNIPGITVELIPGKEYWVDNGNEEAAVVWKKERKYICTMKGRHLFETEGGKNWEQWKYAVDPDKYVEPETEMTIEEIAEALRKSGAIKGKLKIKE